MEKTLNYSYYPGCSLHASASEYDLSTRELFDALGIGLTEIPDWFCCGAFRSTNARRKRPRYAARCSVAGRRRWRIDIRITRISSSPPTLIGLRNES